MDAPLRLLFFGASEFSVPALRALVAGEPAVVAVYTQPDRPAGRGRKLRPSPVTEAALELGLPIERPERLRGQEVLDRLAAYEPDAAVLAAYGLLIPQPALEVPRLGWLNVHPSLLPKYRGASPVAAPILHGDEETGVTIFRMTPGLDDGPILTQARTVIHPEETAGELTERLAVLGAELLLPTLRNWSRGDIRPVPQDEAQATYAPKLTREESLLDWSEPAVILARRVRAYNPWPMAYT
ncbi:MAG: methionyl-tRNA formyltransferase, partial [Chloroflexota bacterium]|nr:methionyl-tRNA formyltransferase [Chloroflexota bacterium]